MKDKIYSIIEKSNSTLKCDIGCSYGPIYIFLDKNEYFYIVTKKGKNVRVYDLFNFVIEGSSSKIHNKFYKNNYDKIYPQTHDIWINTNELNNEINFGIYIVKKVTVNNMFQNRI